MLTEVKAYSSFKAAPTLLLDDNGRAETDLIQIRNIEGLDPVNAAINSSPLGSVDGAAFVGTTVLSRNIVLTVRPNPDWQDWTIEALRRLLYSYFMPKSLTRLRFYSNDMVPVQIEGYVEHISANLFSSDPEYFVSIICPDPYFTAITPEVVTGQTIHEEGTFETIEYNGTIETGVHVRIEYVTGDSPSFIGVQIGDPIITYFEIEALVDAETIFEMNTVPTRKLVQNINSVTGVITNLLSKANIVEGSSWPTLLPGENHFHIITDVGTQDFTLTYYERFGGL